MKILYRSFLQVFKRGNSSLTKILLLGAGLAMGLVLIAKIYFEKTYENYVPDADRVYEVVSLFGREGEETKEFGQTAGAIAPGIKEYSPAVEIATRCTGYDDNVALKQISASGSVSGNTYRAKSMLYADSCFFDVFQRKMYIGDAKHLMKTRNSLMVSRSFAEKLMGAFGKSGKTSIASVIGMTLAPDYALHERFVVGGIYEDYPANSFLRDVDVVLSMQNIITPEYDGTTNWLGNERYVSFIKLNKKADVGSIRKGIVEMCQKNMPLEDLKTAGVNIDFKLASLPKLHVEDENVNRMCQMLTILAIAVLVAAILNYILIAISSLVTKARVVAVHKCYGASKSSIYGMALSDTFAQLVISLLLAAVIVLANKGLVADLVGAPVSSLFVGKSLALLLLICVFIFFVCGVVPGYLYAKVPIATAFRGYRENSRKWKLSLLFLQFVASAFFISLLLVVALQYRLALNCDTGYNVKNVLSINEANLTEAARINLKQELARLPYVKKQAFSTTLPFSWMSGNNVRLANDDKDYMNIADAYSVDEEFLNLMEIPLVAGQGFNTGVSSTKEVMVSRSFVTKMKQLAGWDDDGVDRQVIITQHSEGNSDLYTICGVYEDYMIGTLVNQNDRPTVQFYWKNERPVLRERMTTHLIRLTDMSPEHINDINRLINDLAPGKELSATILSNEVVDLYSDSRHFRDSVLIAGLVVLIITLIGLIGYSRDEVNRRRSEIAIRKINGATVPVLLRLFLNNIVKMALPAIVLGCVFGYLASGRWLEQYSEKVGLDWWLFGLCGAFALLLIVAVVLCNTYKAANANPVENLKCE